VLATVAALTAIAVPFGTASTAEPASAETPTAHACTWKPTAAGTYPWTDAANWSGAVPNAKGSIAGLNIGRKGRMTVDLRTAVTLGGLDIAGPSAQADFAAVSVVGAAPLTFEAATPGVPTRLNISQGKVPVGIRLDLAAGIRLGGSSPLKVTISSPSVFDCAVRSIDLGANTFTIAGARRFNPGDGWKGVGFQVGSLSGSGDYIQEGPGTSLQADCPAFTGRLIVNNGDCSVQRLPAASEYVVAGAFLHIPASKAIGARWE
jgi:hypothetical protein